MVSTPKHPNCKGYSLVGGWATPLKNKKISWDDDPQYMENIGKHVWNHQPAVVTTNLLPELLLTSLTPNNQRNENW